jgi:hypothetical protein
MNRLLPLAAAICLPLAAQQTPTPASPLPTGNAAIDKYNADYLKLTRALMLPKSVADAFGRRIGKRYIAMQITVANRNGDYQWLITDGAVNMERLITYMESDQSCAPKVASLKTTLGPLPPNPHVTGSDLTVMRGVAEKGQLLDPRNLTFRILQGSGTIAAGLLGVTTFGPSFSPSVAAFNGPLLTAYQSIFPDETVNQLNRLNDSTYAANTVVPKQQAKVLVVFIPMSILLDKKEQNDFYSNPNKVLNSPCSDLRLLDASVNGHFVTQLDLSPVITAVSITAAEQAKFATDNFKVAGTITGRFLSGTALSLTGAPTGLSIAPSGAATDDRVNFELSSAKPVAPAKAITITLTKTGVDPSNYTITTAYTPARPTVAASGVAPASIAQGDTKPVTITGTGFTPEARITFSDMKGLTLGDPEYDSTTQLKISVGVAADAADGPRDFVVDTVGGTSGKGTLTIAKK